MNNKSASSDPKQTDPSGPRGRGRLPKPLVQSQLPESVVKNLAARGCTTQRELASVFQQFGYQKRTANAQASHLCLGKTVMQRTLAIIDEVLGKALPDTAQASHKNRAVGGGDASARLSENSKPTHAEISGNNHKAARTAFYFKIIRSALRVDGYEGIEVDPVSPMPKDIALPLRYRQASRAFAKRLTEQQAYTERLDSEALWSGNAFRFDMTFRAEASNLLPMSRSIEIDIAKSIRCETEAMIEAFCSIPACLRAIRALYNAWESEVQINQHVSAQYTNSARVGKNKIFNTNIAGAKCREIVTLCDDLLRQRDCASDRDADSKKKLVQEIACFYPLTPYWREMQKALRGYVAGQEARQKVMGDGQNCLHDAAEDVGLPLSQLKLAAATIDSRMDSIQGLKSHLVKAYVSEIRTIALSKAQTHHEALSLSSILVCEIISGIDKWDYQSGLRLMPFAKTICKRAIEKEQSAQSPLPLKISRRNYRLEQAKQEISDKKGNSNALSELAFHLKVTKKTLKRWQSENMQFVPLNETERVGNQTVSVLAKVPDPQELIAKKDTLAFMRRVFTGKLADGTDDPLTGLLSDLERCVLCYRFGFGQEDDRSLSLREAGVEIHESYETVRTLEKQALLKLGKGPLGNMLRDLCFG